MSIKLVVFFDQLGRTILGEEVGGNADVIEVKNPAVLHAGLNDQGKIQVNLIPAFFREFLKDWNQPLVFTYNRKTISVETNQNELDEKLVAQYQSMYAQRPDRAVARAQARELAPPPEPAKLPEKLNLFDQVPESKEETKS